MALPNGACSCSSPHALQVHAVRAELPPLCTPEGISTEPPEEVLSAKMLEAPTVP